MGRRADFCSAVLSFKISGCEVESENRSCRYLRTSRWTGWPRAAKAFSVGCEKTERCGSREGRSEKPSPLAKACRSRTCSPIATAGRFSVCEYLEVMIPKGMLEREKWLSEGMESQDLRGAMAKVLIMMMKCNFLE